MIKNIYKKISHKNGFIGQNIHKLYQFSSKPAPQQQRLQDWEYVQLITKEIKNNDINEALKHLIQSHLNNQILNKQIYYSLQQKMNEAIMPSGYHEILYKLYRQHFQPNTMTLNWMKKISKTQNQTLSQLLKQDYIKMDQIFPSQVESQEKNVDSIKQNGSAQNDQQKSSSHGRKSRKVPTIPTTDQYFSKSPQQIFVTKRQNVQKIVDEKPLKKTQVLEKQPTKAEIQIQTIAQIQHFLQNMFKEYGRITLHNVQLELDTTNNNQEFDLDEEMNQMYDQNQNFDHENHQIEEQQDEQTMDDYVLEMLSNISKIKIGKIELQQAHFLDSVRKESDKKNNDGDDEK